jgi:HSP20 family protein
MSKTEEIRRFALPSCLRINQPLDGLTCRYGHKSLFLMGQIGLLSEKTLAPILPKRDWRSRRMKAQKKASNPMAGTLPIKKTESIFDELKKMQDRIMHRAYDMFESNGRALGRDLEHWFNAERELVWKPAIELSEKDEKFHVSVAIPGVDPKTLDIEVAPDYLLIKAEVHHEHTSDNGEVHICEFETGSLFRSIRFPKRVDPTRVQAEFKNGMLYLTAAVAEEAHRRKIEVKAS